MSVNFGSWSLRLAVKKKETSASEGIHNVFRLGYYIVLLKTYTLEINSLGVAQYDCFLYLGLLSFSIFIVDL